MDRPVTSVLDLVRGGVELALDSTGRPETPVLVIDLDTLGSSSESHQLAAGARSHVAGSATPVVGTTTRPLGGAALDLATALDLTLTTVDEPARCAVAVDDVDNACSALISAAAAKPVAAVTLFQTLRLTPELPTTAALVVESMAYSMLLASTEFREWRSSTPRRTPPHVADPVRVVREGDVLRATLSNPARRNAYSRDMRDGLVEALTLAALDSSVAEVHLTGDGPAFCSGGDLDEFGTIDDVAVAHLIRLRQGAGAAADRVGERLIAHVHGPCIGAGVEIPAFANRVVAAEGTTFRLPELAMGLIPGAGGTVSIPRRIGRWRTAYLAVTGEPIGVERALAWGLIDGLE